MASLDLKGKRFGRLLVIGRVHVPGANNAMWRCVCDCGNFKTAAAANIGKTTMSCGCLAKETAAELLRGNTRNRTHGLTGTPEYATWSRMKLRCYDPNNPKYERYGARGIIVCDRWLDNFEAFFKDMGQKPSKRHSIGRINNDGPYSPENCRWETPLEQARNTSFNNIITIDGISLCISAWCEALGVPRHAPYELIRGRGKKRNLPPKCTSVEEAVRYLHKMANP